MILFKIYCRTFSLPPHETILRRRLQKKESMKMKKNSNVLNIVTGALLAALVFVATCLSFPNGVGGYTHLGDAMIVLAVMFLGGKRGALSAGLGAMLADIILGYAMWAPVTLVSKAVMALLMGAVLCIEIPGLGRRARWFVAVLLGIAAETLLYSGAAFFLEGGIGACIAEASGMLFQGGLAVVVGFLLVEMLQKTPLRRMMFFCTQEDHAKKAHVR